AHHFFPQILARFQPFDRNDGGAMFGTSPVKRTGWRGPGEANCGGKLDYAVLDRAEAAAPLVASGADDRLALGPGAKAGDPALVDLLERDSGVRQAGDVIDDVR
ncbi:MAG: hypothetical protein ACJ8D5_00775, partial [Sphingomicrobium sp.]